MRSAILAAVAAIACFVPAAAAVQSPEVVAEIRVHGNYATPDADILRIAGISIGQTLAAADVDAVADRLRRSGKFESVEVRKRYRSLTESDQVALIIIVQEHPGVAAGGVMPGPMKRLGNTIMALPVLDYVDGYGFTVGGRISFVNVLGKEGHIILPLTWGGSRQAAVEVDKSFAGGAVRRLRGGAGLFSRTNPAFEPRDFRETIWADATSPSRKFLSVGGGTAWSHVSFGGVDDQITTYGARLVLDTRTNPVFPRNAVYASAGWSVLNIQNGPAITRYRFEARGYVGLIGSTVLSVRALSDTADRVLPDYEKALLGGVDTLRGFRAGSFVGDNLAAASLELRIPLRSPMSVGQSGLTVFADAGAAYDHGVRLSDATAHYGAGVGWYFRAPLIQFGIDVAHGSGGGTRAHVTAGLRF